MKYPLKRNYFALRLAVVSGMLMILNLHATFLDHHVELEYLNPVSTILIVPEKPAAIEMKSALLLSKWLRKIYRTDSGFNIITERNFRPNLYQFVFSLGNTDMSRDEGRDLTEPYSFGIQRKKEIIYIKGLTPTGTMLGTGYFLDHICGIRFYLPGDLFASLPADNRVKVPQNISVINTPFTKYLMSTGYKAAAESDWALVNGLVRKDWGSHQHSMGDRFFDDSIIKLFPDIFPIIKAKRYLPKSKADQNWEPDFAEPQLVDAAVYSAIRYFKNNPKISYISFSVQDSKVYPDGGKMGKVLAGYPDTNEGRVRGYTDAYISFLNKLAAVLRQKLPEAGIRQPKTIVYIVYGNVRDLPREKLDSGILPVTVFHLAETPGDSAFNEIWASNKAWYRINAWKAVTNRIGNDDWAEGKGYIYPRIYTRLVSRYLKTIQRNKMKFDYAHLEFYPNWSLDGPKYYFMGKLYWNPAVDCDSLLTLFCKDMFGKAAQAMKSYFELLEDLNTSMNNDPKRNRKIGDYISQLGLDEKDFSMIGNARKLLESALSMKLTTEQKARIDFFSKGFTISEDFFNIFNTAQIDTGGVTRLKTYLANVVAGDQMMLNMATDKGFPDKLNAILDKVIQKEKVTRYSKILNMLIVNT